MPFLKWSFRGKKCHKSSTSAKSCCQNFIHTKWPQHVTAFSYGNRNGSLSNTKLILKLLDGFRGKAVGSCVFIPVSVSARVSLFQWLWNMFMPRAKHRRRPASGPSLELGHVRITALPSSTLEYLVHVRPTWAPLEY